jgi:Tol biopolymer transport system component
MASLSKGSIVMFGLSALLAGCGSSDNKTATAATPTATPSARAAVGLPPGRIAFRRFTNPAHTSAAIFTVATDGSAEQQVTHPPDNFVDDQPDFSPDGKLIAFDRCQEGARPGDGAKRGFKPCTVWTVPAAGGDAHQIRIRCQLKGRCDAKGPAWAPDGQLVVTLYQGPVRTLAGDYNQFQQSSAEEIDPDTGKQRTIYRRTGWSGDVADPAVSPDGRTLLYSRRNSPRGHPPYGNAMFALDMNGGGHHQVTPWKFGGGDHAVFAPDGTVMLRSYEEDDTVQSQLYNVRLDGTHLRRLTHFPDGTLVLSGSVSPDGKAIVIATEPDRTDGDSDVSVIATEGSDPVPLVSTKDWESAPDWAP